MKTVPVLLALMSGCGAPAEDTAPVDDTAVVGEDTDVGAALGALAGTITWSVDFDAAAEGAGHADCAYTRSYDAVEDRSVPWLCPDCEVVYRAAVDMSAGADCFAQISSRDPSPAEWIGWGGGAFYRAQGDNLRLTEQGTAVVGDRVQTVNTAGDMAASGAGTFGFDVIGDLARSTVEGDPHNGFRPPQAYACRWPKADPPPYEGDYVVEIGGQLPDAALMDACGEPVRLHDLAGRHLVVSVSAADCAPCRAMASTRPAFIQAMADAGIDVEVVTLLAPSLSDALGHSSTSLLQRWTDDFGSGGPVLADRGFGYWVIGAAAGDDFGFPTTIVVGPELDILSLHVGYGSDRGWTPIQESIRAHAGR